MTGTPLPLCFKDGTNIRQGSLLCIWPCFFRHSGHGVEGSDYGTQLHTRKEGRSLQQVHSEVSEQLWSNQYVTVNVKTYSNDFPFLNRILFTTVCKSFEKICIPSNDLVTCLFKTPTHSNDLVTRSLETPSRLNDLTTRLLETATCSNKLVTRSQETPTCWIKYMTVIITRGSGVFSLSCFYISCPGSLSLFHKIS